ncbi:MAG: adenylate/guanylate cyclase domain-containing protein [Rhodospirillaceae bacterium]|nr:adenylate/guanylate cyclase domain-containing protein [Rhodospirillaceae bacterium]MBT4427405.1 adenylate/guanylate cyclase domain-containing protein [Rhodospirillaceae bacterium]MBT5676172.1 adenylate/guanylate cyclase domain-containing protein [Rhodospirillaceae bacterium]MBT5779752.1 adenylate/guanylate cyclase domain-containing protein [Rhodospirillaceae bacterium]MBT6830102.1 adenylate/guanylate cyclase domain-containing protein [Rhodospirillaceae bacterium]
MQIEEFFDRGNMIDLSFFNFSNAITAAYFADAELRILKVNKNFRSFFPVLGNVSNAYFPDVLEQLGVALEDIRSFSDKLEKDGRVLIPQISLVIEGEERIFSLLSTRTTDSNFSYLNGVQGQFVDRTTEFELRRERERLLEDKLRDSEIIADKTLQLENLANRLAKYLSPQIYNSIFTDSAATKDSFARKNLTIFFSDIVGFTDISDGMEPERLAFLINTYLSEMSNIAIEFGGTIDKFIGDAILIFFGDPETEGDQEDAIKCIKMAIRMRERINELQKTWQAQGISKPLRVRMGINTGFCTVGNFGSDHRLEYTVLGSPVNLAARLEAAAEADTILISESTRLLIGDIAKCTFVQEITPKGFVRPVPIYRLDGLTDSATLGVPMKHVGEHVEVNIADSRNIREAIAELKRIQEEFEQKLSAAD